ncbi:MAG: hypothetical protein HC780_11390 [Leptolyngbyaceae cyanobacterium CSU_1_3]|nr:hypothetical protein [Leptolyngbyaceae cyanobacterium CSU_1_3]
MIISAKTYFHQHFPDWIEQGEVPDAIVVRQLWQHSQEPNNTHESSLAQLCLRCYLSHQIEQVCRRLSATFGSLNGFTTSDLLCFVLDDDGQLGQTRDYRSLSATILQTFNPDKGSLKAWVSRQVKQHPDLKQFLLQQGVYLISDWAILNDTTAKQLRRILAETYHFATVEVEELGELLQSFHAVYRHDRLQQRLTKVRPCQPPTPDQLSRISKDLHSRTGHTLTPEAISRQLTTIAHRLRSYRIAAQGGLVASISYDQSDIQPMIDRIQPDQEDEEQIEFLKFYQSQFLESLDRAIADVISRAIAILQKKRTPSDHLFVTALALFHCQGQAMGDIAPQIGFKKQYEVTRLLKLNDLRTDIRQTSLLMLRDRVLDRAKLYTDVDRLQRLDQQVDLILNEQLTSVIEEAESEARSPVRNQPLRSLFARRLCHHLALRKSHL